MSSSFWSDPDDAPLHSGGPIWSRHVSFDPWMLLSPFTFVSFDPWMFLFHLHSHPLSSLSWERKETQSMERNRYESKETSDVSFLQSYYVLYLHVSFDIACFFFVFVVPVWSRCCSSSPRWSDLIQACFFWTMNVTYSLHVRFFWSLNVPIPPTVASIVITHLGKKRNTVHEKK